MVTDEAAAAARRWRTSLGGSGTSASGAGARTAGDQASASTHGQGLQS